MIFWAWVTYEGLNIFIFDCCNLLSDAICSVYTHFKTLDVGCQCKMCCINYNDNAYD